VSPTLAADRQKAYLEDLKTLLTIPSVSTDPTRQGEVRRCAEEVARQMRHAGLQDVQIMQTAGHPSVFGQYLVDPALPTALIYGHYDVQPEDPVELWTSPPFVPTERDGKLYARGATDDKGQFLCHIKAVASLLQDTGTLPINVKVIIEGEEEIGSPHLAPLLEANKELLAADVLVVSDSAMYAPGQPSIVYGLRGLCFIQIDLKGADSDLHSGVFGGAVPNPAMELCRILAQLKDADERVTVPGFYDDVLDLTGEERKAYASLDFNPEEFRSGLGVPGLSGETGYSPLEQRTARPTLEINGMLSGYTGQGAKTVLPARAMAKISCRLVPNQNPARIAEALAAHVRKLCSPNVQCEVTLKHGGHPWITPPDHPALEAAAAAVRAVYGKEPVRVREGGSIPIVVDFQSILGLPGILLGFGLNDENLHAPDEHFRIENFYKGIELSAELMKALAAAHKER
jgi:acetylornithine deacetylase/succinyl-diaminopimelate desuccinylase-like protein